MTRPTASPRGSSPEIGPGSGRPSPSRSTAYPTETAEIHNLFPALVELGLHETVASDRANDDLRPRRLTSATPVGSGSIASSG